MTTPMMAQWEACKAEAREALLFFRLGDFYEAFHEDAEKISKVLGLTLTARQGIPMCGVPFHTAEGYIDKLVAKGHKVAVAEQTESPKEAKGLVKRGVVRIVSPGTIVQSGLLAEKRNNFIAAAAQIGDLYAMAALDVTTGEFRAVELDSLEQLLDALSLQKPAEVLVSPSLKKAFEGEFLLTVREFLPREAHRHLTDHFADKKFDGKVALALAAGTLLGYLKSDMRLQLSHVTTLSIDELQTHMSLDRSTLRNLEITTSLLDFLDQTATPMGGRLLGQWVRRPLLSVDAITERQEAIAECLEKEVTFLPLLQQVKDIERLIMKVSARYAGPRDLWALGKSLSKISPIQDALTPFCSKELVRQRALLVDPISELLETALSDAPPLRLGEGAIFKDGYHPELDHLRALAAGSISWMAQYQATLREETGIKTLKVSYTQAFGYYIEVTRAQSDKIPPSFQRRQTLVNAERFVTPELKEFEHQVLTAEERSKALEAELFEALRSRVEKEAALIEQTAKAVGKIDALLSLSLVAKEHRFCRPIIDESDKLEIEEGRHPIVESAIGRAAFIPNDTSLSPKEQLMLITGPNMAGKSTYIRQVAIIAILAQMGSFVPAKSVRMGLIDKIFSRIGASDDLARGQSTFMVEMAETANILHNATSRSLVLLDEIGRGTSTYDGISIAWAVAEYLLTAPHKQAKTLFATHYWELTRLETTLRGAVNYQVAVQETQDGIVFLRKIIRGGTDRSYGIHVARLAGLPPRVIQIAEEMLRKLEAKGEKRKPKVSDEQMLFL
jgi:DNA mismatch repair protein MutS